MSGTKSSKGREKGLMTHFPKKKKKKAWTNMVHYIISFLKARFIDYISLNQLFL